MEMTTADNRETMINKLEVAATSAWALITSKTTIAILQYREINILTYGAEPFLRSCQLCSHSGNSQQF
jgi:hypothetical protein